MLQVWHDWSNAQSIVLFESCFVRLCLRKRQGIIDIPGVRNVSAPAIDRIVLNQSQIILMDIIYIYTYIYIYGGFRSHGATPSHQSMDCP